MMALATRYEVRTQVASSWVAPSSPAMWGRATLAMEESSTSMKVARVTVMATIHGLMRGRQGCSTVWWAAGASGACALGSSRVVAAMRSYSIAGTREGIQSFLAEAAF